LRKQRETDRPGEIAIKTGPTHRRSIRLYRWSLSPRTRRISSLSSARKIPFVFKAPIFCINLDGVDIG